MSDPDPRIRLMAADKVYERAFGKPPDYDLKRDAEKPKPVFDPRAYTPAELEQLEIALKLLMEGRQVAEEPEDGSRSELREGPRTAPNDSALARLHRSYSALSYGSSRPVMPLSRRLLHLPGSMRAGEKQHSRFAWNVMPTLEGSPSRPEAAAPTRRVFQRRWQGEGERNILSYDGTKWRNSLRGCHAEAWCQRHRGRHHRVLSRSFRPIQSAAHCRVFGVG